MKAIAAIILFLVASSALGSERLSCRTGALSLAPGVPVDLSVEVDEQAKTVVLSAKELGSLRGERVSISPHLLLFEFKTATGASGRASITREEQPFAMFLKVDGVRGFGLFADCRATSSRL